MTPRRLNVLTIAFLCAAGPAPASAGVTVDEAWVRATVPGQKIAAGYMKLRSSEPAALVDVRTDVAPQAEIHEMKVESGIMKMRRIDRIALPAGRTVELKPGGHHLMLMQLPKPLHPGEHVPLVLVIEDAGRQRHEVKVTAEVRAPGKPKPAHDHRH